MKKFYTVLLLVTLVSISGCSKNKEKGSPWKGQTLTEGILPVVFHVLYEDESNTTQNPPQAVFNAHMRDLNKFFSGTLYPNAGSAIVDAQFMLATHAPDGTGLTQPGIHRVKYAGSSNMSANNFLYMNPTGANADIFWDPNYYINVWVFGFLDTGNNNDPENERRTTGISFLPFTTRSNALPGLNAGDYYFSNPMQTVMFGLALNTRYLTDQDQGGSHTFIHEIGHYLGLFHAFQEEGECEGIDDYSDDYCSDTPKYSRAYYENIYEQLLLAHQTHLRISCAGTIFESTNIMDYFDGARTHFTPQQKERIHHVLKYSPLIPRPATATENLLKDVLSKGYIDDEIPEPIMIR